MKTCVRLANILISLNPSSFENWADGMHQKDDTRWCGGVQRRETGDGPETGSASFGVVLTNHLSQSAAQPRSCGPTPPQTSQRLSNLRPDT
jgi:hypothetical protein